MNSPMPAHTAGSGLCRAAVLGAAVTLSACGGSGGGAADTSGVSSQQGSLTLAVTDGPVDEADHVFVQFSSVTLKPAAGEAFTIEFDVPKRVDLLAQRNGNSALLLQDEAVLATEYDWIRLGVDLGPGETVIVIGGAEHDLQIPSGAQTGLKLVSGFTVPELGTLALTIDFDLRKSIIRTGKPAAPPGKPAFTSAPPPPVYKLRPALRLLETGAVGHVAVSATQNYVATTCAGDPAPVVYIFAGGGVMPDDIEPDADKDTPADEVDPVTSAALEQDPDSGDYTGIAGFLDPGIYTAAFLCDAGADGADTNDALTFVDPADVEVLQDTTAGYDLPLPGGP